MVTIRSGTAADLPQILDIYNDVIRNTTAVYSYQPHTLAMRTEWFEARQQAGQPVLVAIEADQVVGFSSYGPFRAWPAYQYTVENSVHVAAEHRGKGIAKLLMKPLIEEALRKQYHAIIAGIDATNFVSIGLHESLGFKEVAHFKEVGFKFGRWLDLKFLELLLDGPTNPVEK